MLAVVLGIFVLACSSAGGGEATTTNTPATSSTSKVPIPRVEIEDTVENILSLYDSNEIAADLKYTGKTALITGEVHGVEAKGAYFEVEFWADFIWPNLVCKMSKDDVAAAADLRQGDVVTVSGKILGVPGVSNVVVEPCEIFESGSGAPAATPRPAATAYPATSSTSKVPISDSLEVRDIISEFTDNAVGATNKYSGQTVTVIGDIQEVDYGYWSGGEDVYIAIGSGWNHVRCIPSDSSQAAQLSIGSEVTVTGTFSEWDGDWVFLYPCSVIN